MRTYIPPFPHTYRTEVKLVDNLLELEKSLNTGWKLYGKMNWTADAFRMILTREVRMKDGR